MSNIFNGSEYIVEQKIVALRDTFALKDRQGNLLAYIKRKFISLGTCFWFENPSNPNERYGEVHGKVLAVRPTFEIYDAQGQLVGTVRKKILKLLGSEWWLENANGVEIARIKGRLTEHDFTIYSTPDGTPMAQIHKKWVTIRDSYCIEIIPEYSPPNRDLMHYLIIAYCVAMDHVEYKKPNRGLLGLVVR